ncbi:unnamed protein product [Cylindrotheca closterium]|uniref:Uncharacterized protein n=1 Tax=Cylindrotheca closterium TaxID=2856 RepID=A0AAD2FBK2_9STRA|nr:unnamed protein product [Cylindrotheca closterium]
MYQDEYQVYELLDRWNSLGPPKPDGVSTFFAQNPSAAKRVFAHGQTLLHKCLQHYSNHTDLVEIFIESFPESLCMEDTEGYMPIHRALTAEKKPDLHLVKLLILKAPETILDSTKAGEFPLHLASRNCDASVVKFLLESFPDVVQYRDGDNKFPVDHALEQHDVDLEVVNLLLEKHSVSLTLLDDTGHLPLHRLLKRNNRRLDAVVNALTEWCPVALRFQDSYGQTPLLQACSQNNTLSQIYSLVRSWPEQVTTQATVNFYETDFNRELLPSALISKSAVLDRVSQWIEVRPDVLLAPDSQGRLPLHYAVVSQSREAARIVQLFLDEAPASASTEDEYGRLPLHYAAATPGCKGSLVNALIDSYPKGLEHADQTGRLPWHYAECARNDGFFDRTLELYPTMDTDLDYVPDEIRWDIMQVIPDNMY